MHNLDKLFNPRSVAVIGASSDESKLGYKIFNNIIKGGFKGQIYPVNPKPGQILGKTTFSRITEIPEPVDMAVLVIPAKFVLQSLQDCAAKKVPFTIIIASGFAEIGRKKEEEEITAFGQKTGMRILGPNVFGVYSSSCNLNATFGPSDIQPGQVAIVTQSGAIGISLIGKTKVENMGLSHIISVGNKADIDDMEIVDYLTQEPNVKVILMYIEGVKSGRQFSQILKKAARKKPVVIVKSGKSAKGAQAISSHTGSLAGQDRVFEEIIRQSGAVRAESIQQALDWSKFLVSSPQPTRENCVIITNGGGMGVLAADACEKYQVRLYDSCPVLDRSFEQSMPSFGSCKNPIDLTGQATGEDYSRALQTALDEDSIGSVICLACETGVFDVQAFSQTVSNYWQKYQAKKPIVFSLFGGHQAESNIQKLKAANIPIFNDVNQAVSCLGALYQTKTVKNAEEITKTEIALEKIKELIKPARKEQRPLLSAEETNRLAEILAIPVPLKKFITEPEQLEKAVQEVGFPLVLKIVSPDILHKSDSGGVIINIQTLADAQQAWKKIMANCRQSQPQARLSGIEVVQMVKEKIEFIVGAKQDPAFGPIVMVGLGGIYVEIFQDVSFRGFPVSETELEKMLRQLKSYALLTGARGETSKDIQALKNTLHKLGTLISLLPEIKEIEINPLIIKPEGQGVVALDIRVLLF